MSWDAIVVGGGPAGSTAAWRLARAGRRTILFEREPGAHHKVCGEFLSVEARQLLGGLGIDPLALGAVPVGRVRLCRGREATEAALPFPALSLSRRVLDEALLAGAAEAGVVVRRGERVAGLERRSDLWSVRTDAGCRDRAPAVFLATGKHDLRGFGRPAGGQDDLIGFKMHWRRPAGLRVGAAAVDLFLFDGGYGGLEPVEDGSINLCLLVSRAAFAALGRRWGALLDRIRRSSTVVDAALAGAEPCWPRPLAIASLPYGHVGRAGDPSLYRLGDQFAVIPSFSGDGIAIALHTARRAAEAFLAGEDARRYADRSRQELLRQVRLATLLSRAAVSSAGRAAAPPIFRLMPSLLVLAARRTRIAGYA